ncbi:GDP-L-fucose synthase [bacterium]|nr:GDP-L-fucose synthase [bacterium]MBU1065991.1 GDP-L-fucose synthase [bacterium]MBU1633354.1 GDP-L-fucose synthase [bacterium]MBU1872991.1 GDP-L-fucose synthase [bacterium]
MEKNSKIYIAGNTGLVGSALVRKFTSEGYTNLVFTPYPEYDLRKQPQTTDFFEREKPEYVIIAAGKVGGIIANNSYRAEFIYDNIMIASNIIHAAYLSKVKQLIFLGSSCIYPKNCPQPMKEEYLLTGPLEPTNEPYGIAKIAGIKLCESYYRQYGCNFYSVMPTNLYGPNDNFDLETSHVLPALVRKFHEAKIKNNKEVTIWGTGQPRREFLHVDDLADAILFLCLNINSEEIFKQGISHLNIGSGEEISISKLAELIKKTVGFTGQIQFDESKPDGMLRKLLSSARLNELGWEKTITMEVGILKLYEWYLKSSQNRHS